MPVPDNDRLMRDNVAKMPVPEFEKPAFTKPPPLAECRVAIVTSAALHVATEDGFEPGLDPKFTVLDDGERALRLGHVSPNFDRGGFAADLNVVYPVDRLHELAARGVIGSVAPHHYAFAGNQDEQVSTVRLDTGPACAKRMRDEGVDVVLLTPV
ncbi:MAG: selenoprotein B glycine/betaine/sarcosine/D-proline reductase [Deltaproteobacteria bacterium]|jgi:D-proline reductase (dithiol) PrdB|nr:selenoprotein B glycine/betaine/sarcosine/D-proline reductase [Deltaproteobacteria bacterium]